MLAVACRTPLLLLLPVAAATIGAAASAAPKSEVLPPCEAEGVGPADVPLGADWRDVDVGAPDPGSDADEATGECAVLKVKKTYILSTGLKNLLYFVYKKKLK